MDLSVLHSNELLNLDDSLGINGEFTELSDGLDEDCLCDCWILNCNKDGC